RMNRLTNFESMDFIEQVSALGSVSQNLDFGSIPEIIGLIAKIPEHETVALVIRDTLKTLLSASEEQTIRFLPSENLEIRKICIEVAGQKKYENAVKKLLDMAGQADSQRKYGVLFTIVSALSRIQSLESLDLFRRFIDHEDDIISSLSIDMIGVMDDESSFDRLCDIISDAENDDECGLPTASAIKSLALFRSSDAISFLISKLHHKNPTVRRIIHQELAALGPEVIEPLSTVFRQGNLDEKILAANILGFIGSKEAGDALVKALDKGLADHMNIRFAIFDSLGRCPGMKSLVCLVDALEETDQMVLMAVVSSLGMQLNPFILDKITEIIRKDNAHSVLLVKAIIASRSPNLFKDLYSRDAKIASLLISEIRTSRDAELMADYREKLSEMDTDQARADMSALESSPDKAVGPHILAVDDSSAMLNFYRSVAASMGLSISTAVNGKEAIDLLSFEGDVCLILSDMNMPVMDGIQFTRAVRSNPALSSIPVIMITTESEQSQKDIATKAGVSDFLTKPFSAEKLQEKIKAFI
ncbi:response regulator, partial [archaeon]|nr:response regulator [archaeon]